MINTQLPAGQTACRHPLFAHIRRNDRERTANRWDDRLEIATLIWQPAISRLASFAAAPARLISLYTDYNASNQRLRTQNFCGSPLKSKNPFPFCTCKAGVKSCPGFGAVQTVEWLAQHNGVRVRPGAHDEAEGWLRWPRRAGSPQSPKAKSSAEQQRC